MYKQLLRPVLLHGDQDIVFHSLGTFFSLCSRVSLFRIPLQIFCNFNHRILATRINGLTFANPIGLEASDIKHRFARAAPSLGFGFGQLSAIVEDYSLISYSLPERRIPFSTRIDASLSKEHQLLLARLADFAILRGSPAEMRKSMRFLKTIIFAEVTPGNEEQVIELAKKHKIGLFVRGDEQIGLLYRATKGKVPILSAGSIRTAEDAYQRIRQGASLLQVSTELLDEGPAIAKSINTGLVKLLYKDGYATIAEAVGASIAL